MKFVPFAVYGPFETRKFLVGMLSSAPAGQTVGQMREKQKLLDAIEAAPDTGVTLEDAQHGALLAVINGRNDFALTSKDIIAIVDDVEQAKAPPPPSAPEERAA